MGTAMTAIVLNFSDPGLAGLGGEFWLLVIHGIKMFVDRNTKEVLMS